MATSRPTSLILPSDGCEFKNGKARPAFQPDLSSSSSVDSSAANHGNSRDRQSSSPPQNFVRTATASTTTDSDLDSEQDDQSPSQPRKSASNSQEQLSRRMKHFHKLFKAEIGDEMPELIDSYVCAYQGDILLQGKMYITDRYLCFHSRIISYVTRHVHRWDQIDDVTKERVAFIFPTAIGIQLKHSDKKLVYASFLQRDQAFDKIYSVWTNVVNGVSSYDDDDDDGAQDGTLKAANHTHRASGRKRESYEVIEGPDAEDEPVVRRRNSHKRPLSVPPPKNPSDRHSTQSTMGNSHGKKSSGKNSTVHPKRSNENLSINNQSRHRSHFSKHEKKPSDPEQRSRSSTNHRRKSSAPQHPAGQSDDPTPRSADRTLSQSTSSPAPLLTRSASVTDTKSSRPLAKLLALIAPVVNLTSQTFLSLVHLVQTLPLKATTCMFLFLILMFFHAFYLMKVANRIEHRLQSLHHPWPSTSDPFAPSPKNL